METKQQDILSFRALYVRTVYKRDCFYLAEMSPEFNFGSEYPLRYVFPNLQYPPKEGRYYRLSGTIELHATYGLQFIVKELHLENIIVTALLNGDVPYVSTATASQIIAKLGESELFKLEKPEQLMVVPGIGKKRAESIFNNIKAMVKS